MDEPWADIKRRRAERERLGWVDEDCGSASMDRIARKRTKEAKNND